ncbi:hypothetical protein WMO40_04550 [Bacillaceae bacterium CLA-AA-H227]|uniref:Uncharacterized protein n=1 Tax=Robertmurraya yapensis (ex Hitch et al 2024) TaxID=3133160 RepID=A0ACC6S7K9_9BACI|nr:hypothetical protein [Bacillus yapensis]
MPKKNEKDNASRVEFGTEFLEINHAKNVEIPFASRQKKDVGSKKTRKNN